MTVHDAPPQGGAFPGGRLPKRIGRYEIVRELGRGMMGVVFEAHDPALGRRIALKTIQLAFMVSPAEGETFEQRFLTEARVAARLSHPGIVVVHDVGRDSESGLLFIALEYLEGRTLADVVNAGVPLDWREALRIVQRVADALHHAHAAGVVHRDIKPANIMLLTTGDAKMMDFGIAKFQGGGLTSTGQFFGTPVFMAPEQAMGQPVDGRADLFSLGATAYSLLSGQLAFGADNVVAIIGRVARHEPPPPSQVVSGIPADVDYIVARALAKRPDDRYSNGQALSEDIDDVLHGRPPRHRAAWNAPPPADGTMVSRGDSAAAGIPPLAPSTTEPSSKPATRPIGGPSAATHDGPRGGRIAPPPSPRRSGALGLAGGIVVVLGVLLAGGLYFGRRPAASIDVPPSGVEPAPSTRSSPTVAPTDVVPTESGSPALADAGGITGDARIDIDFEHPLKSGTLRVWIDDNLVVEEELSSRAKKIVAVTVRKGELRRSVPVSAGRRDVRIEVSWDGKRKTAAIWGNLRNDETRRLEIRMPPVLKSLDVSWK